MNSHFRKLENMYVGAPTNKFFSPRIKVSEGATEIEIDANPDFFHAAHALHGFIYFKMLDDASVFAAASVEQEFFMYTVNFSVSLLRPIISGKLISKGKLVHSTKNVLRAEAELFNDGKLAATGYGTFMRSKMRLDESVGYK